MPTSQLSVLSLGDELNVLILFTSAVCALLGGGGVFLAYLSFFHDHNLFAALLSLGISVVCWSTCYSVARVYFENHSIERNQRAVQAALDHVEQVGRDYAYGHINDSSSHAYQKAQFNLQKVAKAVGATKVMEREWRVADSLTYKLEIGNRMFLVRSDYIFEFRMTGKKGEEPAKGTCYAMRTGVPYPELIASVLLQLKRDPRLFDKWREHHGMFFS